MIGISCPVSAGLVCLLSIGVRLIVERNVDALRGPFPCLLEEVLQIGEDSIVETSGVVIEHGICETVFGLLHQLNRLVDDLVGLIGRGKISWKLVGLCGGGLRFVGILRVGSLSVDHQRCRDAEQTDECGSKSRRDRGRGNHGVTSIGVSAASVRI